MTTQRSLFDAAESTRRRDAGKARAVALHSSWLSEARRVAVRIAHAQGFVSADDLHAAGIEAPPGASYNVFGSVFNDPRFSFAGYVKSSRPEAHRNLLRLWRLVG